jgi:diacylglycerol kinase family enzyme
MRLQEFAFVVSEVCAHSQVAPGRALRWTIITNPHAGGFTIHSRWKKHQAVLDRYRGKVKNFLPRPNSGPSLTAGELNRGGILGTYGLIPTAGPGHAEKIAEALVDEMRAGMIPPEGGRNAGRPIPPFHLVITAGGDGTSLEALRTLFFAPAAVRSNCAVFRLPMGTGNDGADAVELDTALGLLLSPTRIDWAGALRLSTSTAGKGPFLAFNILSVGLDAFVTHMTNKMKDHMPGDSYKLWVDVAALFYDWIYQVGPMDVRVFDREGREQRSFREKVLLLAVGESGRRTYGSQKKILPDDRNVCILRQMPIWRKLTLKEMFNAGTHVDKPEASLFSSSRVEFSGQYPILAQMDGETVPLRPEDFPAVIELTEKAIPVLKPRPPG